MSHQTSSRTLWSQYKALHPQLSIVRAGSQKDRNETLLLGRSGFSMFALICCIHWHADSTQLSKYQPSRQILSTTKTFSRITILQVFSQWQNCSFKKKVYTTCSNKEKLLLNQDARLPDLAENALRMCHTSFASSRIQSDS